MPTFLLPHSKEALRLPYSFLFLAFADFVKHLLNKFLLLNII